MSLLHRSLFIPVGFLRFPHNRIYDFLISGPMISWRKNIQWVFCKDEMHNCKSKM
jgi:hypothetical protein